MKSSFKILMNFGVPLNSPKYYRIPPISKLNSWDLMDRSLLA